MPCHRHLRRPLKPLDLEHLLLSPPHWVLLVAQSHPHHSAHRPLASNLLLLSLEARLKQNHQKVALRLSHHQENLFSAIQALVGLEVARQALEGPLVAVLAVDSGVLQKAEYPASRHLVSQV